MSLNPEARLKKLARESGYDFQLSLQDVARELQRLHVLGRK